MKIRTMIKMTATSVIYLLFATHAAYAADLFVTPVGDDSNVGSKEAPLATLEGARKSLLHATWRVRKRSSSMWQMVYITSQRLSPLRQLTRVQRNTQSSIRLRPMGVLF